jgi:gluconate 5-dehydrogenase
MAISEFRAVIDVHVVGAFAMTCAFLPQLKTTGRGSVLFTASMSSFLGLPMVAGYSASKSAYVGMIRALATELVAPAGVRVNGVAPGWIDPPLFRLATANDPARLAKITGRIPMQRTGAGEDIGWAMTYLAADAARYVTGHIIVADGGALHGF